MAEPCDVDVLVVGAGPTGLTLAGQLAACGVSLRLIDQAPGRSDKSRALVVHARTLELLHRLELSDALIARGKATAEVQGFVEGHERVRAHFGDVGIDDTPFPFLLFVSQVETERLLEGYAESLGVKAERPIQLTSFTQDAEGVTAVLSREGKEERVRCRYIVGCDGAHSAVRKGAGLAFEGAPYPQDFTLADVDVSWDRPPAVHFFMGMAGLLVMIPLAPEPRYRVIVSRTDVSASTTEPTLEEVQGHVTKMVPFQATLSQAHWLARFHLHHRGVDHYRNGRAFVAGDAAHIHSPAGGQGMNTGVQDAFNLGWKLAHALKKGGAEKLLESYHAERYPVGQALLRGTDRIFSMTATRNKLVLAARDVLAAPVVNAVLGSQRLRARAFRFISQLGIAYGESPIVSEHGTFGRGPTLGGRAPDAARATGRRLFDLFQGPDHLVLAMGPAAESMGDRLKATIPEGIRVVVVPEASVATAYGFRGSGSCWVRPDGYLGFRCDGEDVAPLQQHLRAVLG